MMRERGLGQQQSLAAAAAKRGIALRLPSAAMLAAGHVTYGGLAATPAPRLARSGPRERRRRPAHGHPRLDRSGFDAVCFQCSPTPLIVVQTELTRVQPMLPSALNSNHIFVDHIGR